VQANFQRVLAQDLAIVKKGAPEVLHGGVGQSPPGGVPGSSHPPFDTTSLIVQGHTHELTELHHGHLLQLVSIEHPSGATPAWAETYLLCRRL